MLSTLSPERRAILSQLLRFLVSGALVTLLGVAVYAFVAGDYVAVLPIENSIEGGVSATLDLLIHDTRLRIGREVVVPIRHILVGPEGATLDGIHTVMSHPQALAQCRRFLDARLPRAEQVAALASRTARGRRPGRFEGRPRHQARPRQGQDADAAAVEPALVRQPPHGPATCRASCISE